MLQVIKCPSCAAPLECDGDPIERCDFCGSSVSVTQNNLISPDSFGFDGLLKQAHQLKDVLRLVRSGKRVEAIKLYHETFGVGLKEAKDAVERLEHGQSINFRNIHFVSPQSIKLNPEDAKTALKAVGIFSGSVALIVGIIFLLAFLSIIFAIWMSVRSSNVSKSTTIPKITEFIKPSFGIEVMRFGGEGTGTGKFADNRVVAVDGEGRIYSADYQGGRVQIFDESGKFLNQWFVKERDSVIYSLAANRKGTVFVTQPGGRLTSYDGMTGKILNEAKLDFTSALSITADGKILAAAKSDILLIDESLKIVSNFKNAAGLAGMKDGFNYLAANGAGDIFAASDDGKDVAIFSYDGKFKDRFIITPTNVNDIAIDSKGRLFISDSSKIWVYKNDGTLIDSFNANQCFALIFNEKDELLIAARPFVIKYQINQ